MRQKGRQTRTLGGVVFLATTVALGAASVRAATLVVMSAGALEAGIRQLAQQFEREGGHTVRVEIGNAPQLTARLTAGDSADVLVAPANVIDQAVASGRVLAASRVTVGRVGVGILVSAGAPKPDVGSVDALRTALLGATALIYNQGSSGTYIEQMLANLGIATAVASKSVRVLNGEAVMARLAEGRAGDVAFVAISDGVRARGMQYLGPLPTAVQNFTTYDAALMAPAREPTAAAAFLRFLGGPAARQVWAQAGVE